MRAVRLCVCVCVVWCLSMHVACVYVCVDVCVKLLFSLLVLAISGSYGVSSSLKGLRFLWIKKRVFPYNMAPSCAHSKKE